VSTQAARALTITAWAIVVPFVALALGFALVQWLRPEWHSQSAVAPVCIAIAIIAGGSSLFQIRAALPLRILSFIAYAIVLPFPLLYFGAFFICFFYGCPP
jgi:hypothetical protein